MGRRPARGRDRGGRLVCRRRAAWRSVPRRPAAAVAVGSAPAGVAAVGGRGVPARPDDELNPAARHDERLTEGLPPSGAQYEISAGSHRAVVVAVGGGLRSYRVDGRDVFDGYDGDRMADGARGQTLAPWPNRVKDGAWTWNGEEQQLPLTEPDKHNAIHGLVRWLGWSL